MKLIAQRPIRHSGGTIQTDQSFIADGDYAEQLIQSGAALPEDQHVVLPWNGSGYWRVQPVWQGDSVVVIGGGPSLSGEQIELIARADPKVIAINNAVELAPWADILYFCDARWADWHRDAVESFAGWRVTLENLHLQKQFEVRCMRDYGVNGWAPKNDGVTNGRNGGYQAVHLAAWLGAARVLLVGFDMRQVDGRMHWHTEHPVATAPSVVESWRTAFDTLAPELKRHGVEVINCTPDSALTVFPYQPLRQALGIEELYAPLRSAFPTSLASPEVEELPPPEPSSNADSEPAQEAGFLSPDRGGEFGGAGASGAWSDNSGPSGDGGPSGDNS